MHKCYLDANFGTHMLRRRPFALLGLIVLAAAFDIGRLLQPRSSNAPFLAFDEGQARHLSILYGARHVHTSTQALISSYIYSTKSCFDSPEILVGPRMTYGFDFAIHVRGCSLNGRMTPSLLKDRQLWFVRLFFGPALAGLML